MLTPLAVQNEDVLRALATGQFTAKDTLAASLTPVRDPSNFRKTLARLEGEGLISGLAITDRAKACLVAFDVAAGKVAIPEGHAYRFHRQLRIGALNPRKRFDEAALDELMEDIVDRGLNTNLEARADDPKPNDEGLPTNELVAGERRWRAIGRAIEQGRLDRDFPILVKIKALSDAEHRVSALMENLQREGLTPLEEALAFDDLMKTEGLSTAQLAARLKKSQKTVQNRIRLLSLSEDLKARMELPEDDPDHLGYKAALAGHLIQKKEPAAPKEPEAPTLSELSPKLALALLELADKAVKFPSKISQPGFTELLRRPDGGALTTLNERKIITFREEGGKWHAKILAHSSGALAWLNERGIYGAYPDDTIYGARKAVLSEAALVALEEAGLYATELLNIPRAGSAQVDAEESEPAPTKEVNPDEATDETVTPAQLLILAEIADKMMREPRRTSTGDVIAHVLPSVRADEAILKPLRWGGYLAYGNDTVSDFYRTTELADRLLKAKGFHPLHSASALINVRKFARRVRTGTDPYITPWLNRAAVEANPVRHEPQHAPEALSEPVERPDFMGDLEPHLMAGAFDRTSKRSCNTLVTLLPTGDDAKQITLLAPTEDDARQIGAALAESGLYAVINIHARSGKLLMHWG